MALSSIQPTVRSNMANAFVDAFDVGATNVGGKFQIFTTGFAVELASPTMSDPAFGAASGGVATANAITDATAIATGTAADLRLVDRGVTTVADGTVSTTGADLNLNTTAIATSDIVSITAATVTAPAAA